MPTEKSGLLQGTLDMLILKTVALGPVHGYGISIRIRQISKEVLQVQQGSLYPALHRLERRRLARRGVGANPKTAGRPSSISSPSGGRRQLAEEQLNWQRLAGAVTSIMQTAE